MGRIDLGCPFGCSQAHKQSESTKRSTAYYQTPEGKEKKKQLNAKAKAKQETEKQKSSLPQKNNMNAEQYAVGDKPSEHNTPDKSQAIPPDNKMLHYLQCLLNLIEQQFLTYQKILALLNKKIRQHGLRKRKEMDYVIGYYCSQPP